MSFHDEPETPDSLYECPVCKRPIRLIGSWHHIDNHRRKGEVRKKHEGWIAGLEDVAIREVAGMPNKPAWLSSRIKQYNKGLSAYAKPRKKPRVVILQGGAWDSNRRRH